MKHLIIPSELGGSNIEPSNITTLERGTKRKFDALFGTQLPVQQLEMIIKIAQTALSLRFKRDFQQVIGDHRDDAYQPECFARIARVHEMARGNRFSMGPQPHNYSSHD